MMRTVRRCACAIATGMAFVAGAHAADLLIVIPREQPAAYRGAVNFDSAGGGTGSMLYPAPGAVGLLAAVLTHSVLVEQMKASQKEKMQQAADKVLAKYRAVIDKITNSDIATAAIARLHWEGGVAVGSPPASSRGWVLETSPVLVMTQDERALFLEAAFKVTEPGAAAAVPVTVRVVSLPRPDTVDVSEYWLANEGAALKQESAALFTHALELALDARRLAAAPDAHRTVRYPQGGSEQIERATILGHGCDRQVIRNLRGTLMSVPAPQEQGAAACEGAAAGQ